jgi:hypothetical protein
VGGAGRAGSMAQSAYTRGAACRRFTRPGAESQVMAHITTSQLQTDRHSSVRTCGCPPRHTAAVTMQLPCPSWRRATAGTRPQPGVPTQQRQRVQQHRSPNGSQNTLAHNPMYPKRAALPASGASQGATSQAADCGSRRAHTAPRIH